MTQGFFSKQDSRSIDILTDIFCGRNGYVWFIEHADTKEWLSKDGSMTTDPQMAKQFKSEMEAVTHCVVMRLGTDYIQTEHEFVETQNLA